MSPDRVLAELPADPVEALASIEFWLACEAKDPRMSADEKVLVLKRKAEIEAKVRRR